MITVHAMFADGSALCCTAQGWREALALARHLHRQMGAQISFT